MVMVQAKRMMEVMMEVMTFDGGNGDDDGCRAVIMMMVMLNGASIWPLQVARILT